MPPQGFHCRRCGHCCLDLETSFLPCSKEDYRRWKREGRTDILDWVGVISHKGKILMLEMWVDPRTHETPSVCPWIRKDAESKTRCLIYDTRPVVCREYPPTMKWARKTGCPGCNAPVRRSQARAAVHHAQPRP